MAAAGQSSGFGGLPVAAKALLLVLMLGLLSAIYYFAMHMSLADDIEAAKKRTTQLEGQLREAEKRQQEYLRLTQELANREAIDRRNKRILPEKAEIPAFLQDLNRLAELSGLAMRLVAPRPEEAETHYVKIPVSLQLTGRYHQLMKFFYNVSRLERVISMENITLRNPRLDGEDVILDVDVRAITYRRPGPAEAGGKGKGKASAKKGGH